MLLRLHCQLASFLVVSLTERQLATSTPLEDGKEEAILLLMAPPVAAVAASTH